MTRTFQEISDALENSNLDPFALEAAQDLLDYYADDDSGEYPTEDDAVRALIDDLYVAQEVNDKFMRAAGVERTFVVVMRLDGPDKTIILSRELRAANKEEATDLFKADLMQGNPRIEPEEFEFEVVYGPF